MFEKLTYKPELNQIEQKDKSERNKENEKIEGNKKSKYSKITRRLSFRNITKHPIVPDQGNKQQNVSKLSPLSPFGLKKLFYNKEDKTEDMNNVSNSPVSNCEDHFLKLSNCENVINSPQKNWVNFDDPSDFNIYTKESNNYDNNSQFHFKLNRQSFCSNLQFNNKNNELFGSNPQFDNKNCEFFGSNFNSSEPRNMFSQFSNMELKEENHSVLRKEPTNRHTNVENNFLSVSHSQTQDVSTSTSELPNCNCPTNVNNIDKHHERIKAKVPINNFFQTIKSSTSDPLINQNTNCALNIMKLHSNSATTVKIGKEESEKHLSTRCTTEEDVNISPMRNISPVIIKYTGPSIDIEDIVIRQDSISSFKNNYGKSLSIPDCSTFLAPEVDNVWGNSTATSFKSCISFSLSAEELTSPNLFPDTSSNAFEYFVRDVNKSKYKRRYRFESRTIEKTNVNQTDLQSKTTWSDSEMSNTSSDDEYSRSSTYLLGLGSKPISRNKLMLYSSKGKMATKEFFRSLKEQLKIKNYSAMNTTSILDKTRIINDSSRQTSPMRLPREHDTAPLDLGDEEHMSTKYDRIKGLRRTLSFRRHSFDRKSVKLKSQDNQSECQNNSVTLHRQPSFRGPIGTLRHSLRKKKSIKEEKARTPRIPAFMETYERGVPGFLSDNSYASVPIKRSESLKTNSIPEAPKLRRRTISMRY